MVRQYTCHTQKSAVTPDTAVICVCVCVSAGSLGCRADQARCFSNLAFAYSQLREEEEAAESFIHALQGFRDTGNISNSCVAIKFYNTEIQVNYKYL